MGILASQSEAMFATLQKSLPIRRISITRFWSFWAEGVFNVKYTESLKKQLNPAENRAQKWELCSLLWFV